MKPLHPTLAEVEAIAKEQGLKVFTFETRSNIVEQIFITDGTNIGTCSVEYGLPRFGTVHKPIKGSGIGTGFGDVEFDHIEEGIVNCMKFAPSWVGFKDSAKVIKYKDADEYINKETILKYYYYI